MELVDDTTPVPLQHQDTGAPAQAMEFRTDTQISRGCLHRAREYSHEVALFDTKFETPTRLALRRPSSEHLRRSGHSFMR